MSSRRVTGGACHPGGGSYYIFSEKIAPALGRQSSPPANAVEGPLLISRPVTLRDEPEEKTRNAVRPALCCGSAAGNTCGAFAERIKQKGNYRPWALSRSSAQLCSSESTLPAALGAAGTQRHLPPPLRAPPALRLHRSAVPALGRLCWRDGFLR